MISNRTRERPGNEAQDIRGHDVGACLMKSRTCPPLLEMHAISMRFGFVDALKLVDLSMWPGEVVSLVGDNGAGKSTLIKILAGFHQPSSGLIRFRGKTLNLSSIRDADANGIASVFQGQELCDNLNVAANIFLGREIRSKPGVRDDDAMVSRARDVLGTFATSISAGQSISALSGGQRQTVALARTLLYDPALVLLDEPTASLSVIQTSEVLTYIKKLRAQGRSVLMVCHDLPDVFAVSDRIVVLRHGRVNGMHYTAETTYEQIIAEIAGVAGDDESVQHLVSEKTSGGMAKQRTLISRSMSRSSAPYSER
ncbi:MAG: ATP-binding cassette domain-containing protein [Bifidobacterium sp.]